MRLHDVECPTFMKQNNILEIIFFFQNVKLLLTIYVDFIISCNA